MCFFNAVVQCLAHIELLNDYFLKYKEFRDLNYWNSNGSFGEITL